ncbi:MAG: hypothetical protein Q4C58_00990 [Eubacteriales bacterium]|nr:hypothetical protein [Eubacteriales bacterium]
MTKKAGLIIAAIVCVISLAVMTAVLVRCNKNSRNSVFTPPPFESEAVSGTPDVPDELGWSEIYQEGMGFKAYVCGNVIADGDTAEVYFTNSEDYDVWLKLRILNEKGAVIGESGLLKPGEYVKSVPITSDIADGEPVRLKIMAYEPETYHSAGAVTLNTTIREGESQ